MTTNLTNTQLDTLADCIAHLVKLARQHKAAVGNTGQDVTPTAARAAQTEAARQGHFTTTGQQGQGGGQ